MEQIDTAMPDVHDNASDFKLLVEESKIIKKTNQKDFLLEGLQNQLKCFDAAEDSTTSGKAIIASLCEREDPLLATRPSAESSPWGAPSGGGACALM